MDVYTYVCLYVDRQTERQIETETLVDCQDFSWYLIGKKKNG